MNMAAEAGLPPAQGLYDPALEHDSCGFGFVVDIKGRPSHDIVVKSLEVLCNLEHRGATGAEKETGDGAGILLQTPHAFLAAECGKLGLELPGRGRYGAAGRSSISTRSYAWAIWRYQAKIFWRALFSAGRVMTNCAATSREAPAAMRVIVILVAPRA